MLWLQLEVDKEYVVCITAQAEDGIYWGKVIYATQGTILQKAKDEPTTDSSYCDVNGKDESQNVMVVASIEKSIQCAEKKLREKNERLQAEREIFELKKYSVSYFLEMHRNK